MSLTTEKIYLDFYNHNITSIYAKQLDTESRIVNVTCTDHGKKVTLNAENMSVFVRYKKSDGNIGFYDGKILEDGTIDIKLTQQMLAVSGKQTADVIIATATGIKADSLADITNLYDLGVTIISVMPFTIINVATAVENSSIVSESEFDALNAGITRLVATETTINENESTRQANEITRKYNEEIRQNNESDRKAEEIERINAESLREKRFESFMSDSEQDIVNAVGECSNAASDAIAATSTLNNTIEKAESATSDAYDAAVNAETKAEAANKIITECQIKMDEIETNGAVLNSQLGVVNGVATLDENGVILSSQMPFSVINNLTTVTQGDALDAYQGKVLKDGQDNLQSLITELQNALSALPVIYVGDVGTIPDDSIGKDGDYYVIPVE